MPPDVMTSYYLSSSRLAAAIPNIAPISRSAPKQPVRLERSGGRGDGPEQSMGKKGGVALTAFET